MFSDVKLNEKNFFSFLQKKSNYYYHAVIRPVIEYACPVCTSGPWQIVTLIAGSKRWSLLMAGDDDEVFITSYAEDSRAEFNCTHAVINL